MIRIALLSLGIIVTSLVGASGYAALDVCAVPVTYRIGTNDERFNLSDEEIKLILEKAEAAWEAPTGRELFVYDESADFTVNFIFDDRQERLITEAALRESLDQKESTSESVQAQYDALKVAYKEKAAAYESSVTAYEKKLATFNAEVETYNREGGAPPTVFASLQEREKALDAEAEKLTKRAKELENIVADLNELGDRGNRLIEQYNTGVTTYNKTFGEPNEFTQGDYQGDHINVYTFGSEQELLKVLVHEFGHALNIGHVEGSESFMYYLLQDQPDSLMLSDADLAAFAHSCGEEAGIVGWMQKTHTIINDMVLLLRNN
jgi:hypothetical protein